METECCNHCRNHRDELYELFINNIQSVDRIVKLLILDVIPTNEVVNQCTNTVELLVAVSDYCRSYVSF